MTLKVKGAYLALSLFLNGVIHWNIRYYPKYLVRKKQIGVLGSQQMNNTPKEKFCARDPGGDKILLDNIQIPVVEAELVKVLCFIPVVSTDHGKLLEVLYTWGKRCDKLVFASNKTDLELGAIKIDLPLLDGHDWRHLWLKERESMRYLWKTYGGEYDWFLKADLDTFIIMENLKAYLISDEIQQQSATSAMILGHRITRYKKKTNNLRQQHEQETFDDSNTWFRRHRFGNSKIFGSAFLERSNNTFIYTQGGAYVMNQEYVRTLNMVMDEPFCLSSDTQMTQPEDAAINFCMGFLGHYPYDTRDASQRERFHVHPPRKMFEVNGGYNCCSQGSISFHALKRPGQLHNLERILYC